MTNSGNTVNHIGEDGHCNDGHVKEQPVPVASVSVARWRFRIAAAVFIAWILYLAWVSWQVITK